MTENQIVAAFLSMAVLILLWLADYVGRVVNNVPVAQFVRTFSFNSHYQDSFANGLVRLPDLVFFIGVMIAVLFVTTRIVESRRWR